MKRLKIMLLFIFALLIVPTASAKASAADSKEIVLDEKTTYTKTVSTYENVEWDKNGNVISADLIDSKIYELTEEEYNNADISSTTITRGSTTVDTTYKKMTIYLLYENGSYRYKNQVNWKNFPAVRKYDIIGIGHYGDVTINGSASFLMEYTTVTGSYYTNAWHIHQNFTYGSSATFLLPLANLSSLTVTYSYYVQKVNSQSTIYSQGAFGDYSHGTDNSLILSEALNHVVNQNLGIVLDSSVYNKFDTMPEAATYWSGTW